MSDAAGKLAAFVFLFLGGSAEHEISRGVERLQIATRQRGEFVAQQR